MAQRTETAVTSGEVKRSLGEGQVNAKMPFIELPRHDLKRAKPLGTQRIFTPKIFGVLHRIETKHDQTVAIPYRVAGQERTRDHDPSGRLLVSHPLLVRLDSPFDVGEAGAPAPREAGEEDRSPGMSLVCKMVARIASNHKVLQVFVVTGVVLRSSKDHLIMLACASNNVREPRR